MAKFDKLLEQASAHLDPDEQALAAVLGTYETKIMGGDSVRTGILLATPRRLLFYAKKVAGYDLESFPYSNISSFEQAKGMMGHKISFFASGNRVEMKWINDVARLAELVGHVRSRMGKESSQAPPQPPGADPMEHLRRLGELRDAGVLTPEEFEAKKAELLNRI